MPKKISLIIAIFLLTFISLTAAFAASPLIAQVPLNPDLKPEFATDFNNIVDQSATGYGNYVLQIIAGSLIYIAGPLAVLMIAYAGWNYVNARGDQNKLEESKKTIIWASLGLAAIIISYSIVSNIISIILSTTNTVQPPPPPANLEEDRK